MNKKCNKNGITLISLIITIIVMLILVAVTISMAVNGGLFDYAGNAAKDTEIAKQGEQNLANVESGLSTDELIAKYTGDDLPKPAYSNDLLNPTTGVLTKNAIYTDPNTQTVEIPKGFAVVEDYNIINQGLVISDEFDSNGVSTGNEFVWIPVEYTEEGELDENGLDSGFLKKFYRSAWDGNTRGTSYAASTSFIENLSNDPTGKYNEMMLSVQKHKGFYIGRYETGKNDNGEIIVKRDAKIYTNIKWGDSMTEIGTEGAVYLSRNMYTRTSHNVTSTLCYGVQWDGILDFIKDDNHNISSSANWGNYHDTNADKWRITRRTAMYYDYDHSIWKAITQNLEKSVAGDVMLTAGANDNFQAKNIFDIAGNCWEWTMEERSQSIRVVRGGNMGYVGSSGPASLRFQGKFPTDESFGNAFRIALYL